MFTAQAPSLLVAASRLGVDLSGPNPGALIAQGAKALLAEPSALALLNEGEEAALGKFALDPLSLDAAETTRLRSALQRLAWRGELFPTRPRTIEEVIPARRFACPWFETPADRLPQDPVEVVSLARKFYELGAAQPITDVLIWNSGMSATRLVDGLRHLSYRLTGNRHAIRVTTVQSDGDLEARFRFQGDAQVRISGRTSQETYNDLEKYRQAIRQVVAETRRLRGPEARVAVAVGWGYIAENPAAARIAREEGVIFIGPSERAITDLGDKGKAKAKARPAGVPLVPGTETALVDVEEAREVADQIGYPVVLKALAGGGGKGIRFVNRKEELRPAFDEASREAVIAFSDDRLLLEKQIIRPRHIEVQIVRDCTGKTLALGERECTLQRNAQKEVESGAHETVPIEILRKMRQAAVAIANASDYLSVGTVEFLYDEVTGEFYFMEVNTRLQVEHPVTEMQAGIDLVALQIAVAAGVKIDSIFSPEQQHHFMEEVPEQFTLAVRIIAKDGWTSAPTTGVITELHLPQDVPGLRMNWSVSQGSKITGLGDVQHGHLFVTARTRREALTMMLAALAQLREEGVLNNIDFLRHLLNCEEVQSNQRLHTGFIEEEFLPRNAERIKSPPHVDVALVAMAIRKYMFRMEEEKTKFARALAESREGAPAASREQTVMVPYDGNRYLWRVWGDEQGNYDLVLERVENDEDPPYDGKKSQEGEKPALQVHFINRPGTEWEMELNSTHYSIVYGDQAVAVNGGRPISFQEYDPTRLKATSDGKVTQVMVEAGEEVGKEQLLLTYEVAKMPEKLKAPSAGRVGRVLVEPQDQVKGGQTLVDFEPVDYRKPPPGEKIPFVPSTQKELSFPALVQRSMGGMVVSGAQFRAALANYQREASSGSYVSETRKILESFWKREVSGGRDKEGRKDEACGWAFALSRATLREQVAFINDLLISYRSVKLDDLGEEVRGSLQVTLDQLAKPIGGNQYNLLNLEARRLLDRMTPPRKVDVLATLTQLAQEEREREGLITAGEVGGESREAKVIMETLSTYPFSLAAQILPLVRHEDPLVRRYAGALLLRRTYGSSYPLKTMEYHGEREGEERFLFSFQDCETMQLRRGIGMAVSLGEELPGRLEEAHQNLVSFNIDSTDGEKVAPLTEAVIEATVMADGTLLSSELTTQLKAALDTSLPAVKIRRVTFTVFSREGGRRIVTFRPSEEGWVEDPIYQDLHPIDAELLELGRFNEHFDLRKVSSTATHVHLFHATAKEVPEDQFLSARVTIPATHVVGSAEGASLREVEEAFDEAIDSLTRANLGLGKPLKANLITLNLEHPASLDFGEIEGIVRRVASRHSRVDYEAAGLNRVEIRLAVADPQDRSGRGYKRVVVSVSRPTSQAELSVRIFVVARDERGDGDVLVPLDHFLKKRGDPAHSIPSREIKQIRPYLPITPLEARRAKEHARNTTYAYDKPEVLREQLGELWSRRGQVMPEDAFVCREIVLREEGNYQRGICLREPQPGKSKLAVVGFAVKVRFPDGKEKSFAWAVNDQSIENGSMDLPDDHLYAAIAAHGRRSRTAFVGNYAGSGARMIPNAAVGEAAIQDEATGELYLTRADYERLASEVTAVEEGDRYRITGVKAVNQSSLRGSGLMIRATIEASEEVPTLGVADGDVVTGKQAYAYRECHDTIQLGTCAVILSGKKPINAGKGKGDVYTSDHQIGSPEVHEASGVTHKTAPDGPSVMAGILEWLQFQTPDQADPDAIFREDFPSSVEVVTPLSPLSTALWERVPEGLGDDWDVAERLMGGDSPLIDPELGVMNQQYDPRGLARTIFDGGTFHETDPAYSLNVVTGYARLGGRNVAVILFDPRTRKTLLPPDPGAQRSEADRTRWWPGRVWGPEGAHKTKDFMWEVSRKEGMPLFIFPNIRGFLGDPTALLGEVIKFGAEIAREIRKRKGRTVVWMPPYSELRGGAEVVIDPNLNPGNIVFLMDPTAILGVLEPSMMLDLPKVARLWKKLGENDAARRKVLRLLELADVASIANEVGKFHGVVPTRYARRALYAAAFLHEVQRS